METINLINLLLRAKKAGYLYVEYCSVTNYLKLYNDINSAKEYSTESIKIDELIKQLS